MSTLTLNLSEKLVKDIIESDASLKAEIDAFLVPLRSEKSGGLGLGLAIVRRIIEAYGGTIVFDVVEPQGVRVEARLPARPDL